jgi:cyclic lactone autoinducer peptide
MIKENVLKFVAKATKKVAETSSSKASALFSYQPKVPKNMETK